MHAADGIILYSASVRVETRSLLRLAGQPAGVCSVVIAACACSTLKVHAQYTQGMCSLELKFLLFYDCWRRVLNLTHDYLYILYFLQNVVMVQPPPNVVTRVHIEPVRDHYLILSIIAVILSFFCGIGYLVCSIPALVLSLSVSV